MGYVPFTATCRTENSLGTKTLAVTANFKTLIPMKIVNIFQSHLSISASALKEEENRKF
jgi:hypothetical protein